MNWYNFLLIIATSYGIYYAINILYDIYISRSKHATDPYNEEIVLSHQPSPIKVSLQKQFVNVIDSNQNTSEHYNYNNVLTLSEQQATGGVNMQELFSLMQNQVIQYTKTIPY